VKTIKRSDFSGWTIKLFGYHLELVTFRGIPCTLALSTRQGKTLWRLEKEIAQ
jgi:hypothetical protein